jgi:hypothetical protein
MSKAQERLDVKYKRILKFLRETRRAELPALLDIKKDRLPKLSDRRYRIVAQDREPAILLITPDAPPAGEKAI